MTTLTQYYKQKKYIISFNNKNKFDCSYELILEKPSISDIYNNDWTQENCQYPTVKEGVVCKSSKLLKGQRLPMVKVKTKWWLDKLHNRFDEKLWKELE